MICDDVTIEELTKHLEEYHKFKVENWMDLRYLTWVHQQIYAGN